jgi:hypothetical protein
MIIPSTFGVVIILLPSIIVTALPPFEHHISSTTLKGTVRWCRYLPERCHSRGRDKTETLFSRNMLMCDGDPCRHRDLDISNGYFHKHTEEWNT